MTHRGIVTCPIVSVILSFNALLPFISYVSFSFSMLNSMKCLLMTGNFENFKDLNIIDITYLCFLSYGLYKQLVLGDKELLILNRLQG